MKTGLKKKSGCEPGFFFNETIFRSLCVACDRVLLAADSTIERVSIPWLHIVREHPVLLRNYTEIVDNKRDQKLTHQRWLRLIKNKVWWVYQLGKSIRSDGKLWQSPVASNDPESTRPNGPLSEEKQRFCPRTIAFRTN